MTDAGTLHHFKSMSFDLIAPSIILVAYSFLSFTLYVWSSDTGTFGTVAALCDLFPSASSSTLLPYACHTCGGQSTESKEFIALAEALSSGKALSTDQAFRTQLGGDSGGGGGGVT